MCALYLNKAVFIEPVEAVNFTSFRALDLSVPTARNLLLSLALTASHPGRADTQ